MIQHPVTTEWLDSAGQIRETVEAIRSLNVQAIVLLPNNDAGYSGIINYIHSAGLKWYPSFSSIDFVNIYRRVWAIVGNSSSGIHEALTMKIPAVNIGTRQLGRERGGNVLDVPYDRLRIRQALDKALFDEEFRGRVRDMKNPYGDGNSAEKIVRILKTVSLEGIIQKRFYD